MLYTRTGDDGKSGLFGSKKRVSKSNPLYDTLGTLDELNSLLGLCRAYAISTDKTSLIQEEIRNAQEALFIIQAEVAGADEYIDKKRLESLENTIDSIEVAVGNPHAFVIPGATITSALLDYARAVARRAERSIIKVSFTRKLSKESLAYVNRLSSLLYSLARYTTNKENVKEVSPSYL